MRSGDDSRPDLSGRSTGEDDGPGLIADLEEFVQDHRPHGVLVADASPPGPNGHRLEVGCPCGVVFERWVTPEDAGVQLSLFARWN
jgi:hypothetical protein